MNKLKLCMTLAALVCGSAVQAQSTLGELLDQGARKLATAAEVQALGDLRFVRQAPDADAYMNMRADGTVIGMVHNKQGAGSSEAIGSWSMDANGQRCVDVALPAFSMRWKQCGFTYQLGREIFFAASDSDRGASVTAYTGPAFLR